MTRFNQYSISMNLRREERLNDVSNMSLYEVRLLEEEEEEQIEEMNKNPLFDELQKNEDRLRQFIGFQVDEFIQLYSAIEDCLTRPVRGRKPKFTNLDQFLLFLHFLREYPTSETMKAVLSIEPSTFDGIVYRVLDAVGPKLIEEFITKPAQNTPLIVDEEFPACPYVVDATVQQINQPSLDWNISSKYFSGKHNLYCLKSQVIVMINGLAMHIVSGIEGSVHDKKIFDENLEDFKQKVVKFHENDPFNIIGDKGYQDSKMNFLTTPYKGKPPQLSSQQLLFNENLGKVRIIVENFFGRLKSRYNITGSKYRGSHERYALIFKVCCALVNFEILNGHPLRSEDRTFFIKHRATIRKLNEEENQYLKRRKTFSKEQRIKLYSEDLEKIEIT